MNQDYAFQRRGARRPPPRIENPLLQWATGLQTKNRTVYVGWFVQTGVSEELDSVMQHCYGTETIKHGGGELVEHWIVPTANLIVMAEGVQGLRDIKGEGERYGCAIGWRTLEDGRPQSFFKATVLLRDLTNQGWYYPLMLTVKSTLTNDVTQALMRQYDVIDAAAASRKKNNKPHIDFPFYAFSIELGPGAEVKRGTNQTKEIVPPVAIVPEVIESSYLSGHYVGGDGELMQYIEGSMDAIIEWSIASSVVVAAAPATDEIDS